MFFIRRPTSEAPASRLRFPSVASQTTVALLQSIVGQTAGVVTVARTCEPGNSGVVLQPLIRPTVNVPSVRSAFAALVHAVRSPAEPTAASVIDVPALRWRPSSFAAVNVGDVIVFVPTNRAPVRSAPVNTGAVIVTFSNVAPCRLALAKLKPGSNVTLRNVVPCASAKPIPPSPSAPSLARRRMLSTV